MNELEVLQQEVKQYVGTIPTEIKTPEQMQESAGWFASIRKRRKEIEKYFDEKFITPAKALLKNHQNEAKLAVQPLVEAEAMLTTALRTYRQMEAERIRKEQEKLNKQYAKKVEKAIEKGKDVEDVAPPVVVEQPASSVKSSEGTVTFRKVKKLSVFDETVIPDTFLIVTRTLNKKMVEAALRAGQAVPGCCLIEEEELAQRRA